MIRYIAAALLLFSIQQVVGWGFFAHKKINYHACFLLPTEMAAFYKEHQVWLTDHSTDPDKRRHAVKREGPRHYIDLDKYGSYPFPDLPRSWDSAVARYTEDTLQAHGIVPYHIQRMMHQLTKAFSEKNKERILKLSADIGHYMADACVPLHTTSNYNGQQTGQKGIHGFWESRLPELYADNYNYLIGHPVYIQNRSKFIWTHIMESHLMVDSVLTLERELDSLFAGDKYAYEQRGSKAKRVYSREYSEAYHQRLNGMVERRMRKSILAVASLWFTAWVDSGQPSPMY